MDRELQLDNVRGADAMFNTLERNSPAAVAVEGGDVKPDEADMQDMIEVTVVLHKATNDTPLVRLPRACPPRSAPPAAMATACSRL